MVNLNNKTITKIADVEKKCNQIYSNAKKTSEKILTKSRNEVPKLLNTSKDNFEKVKSEKIISTKQMIETECDNLIIEGKAKITSLELEISKKIDKSVKVTMDSFINKINKIE